MTESNSGQPSCRGAVQRLQTKGEDLLRRFAQTDADNPPPLARNHIASLSSESCPEFNARQSGQTHFDSRFTQQLLIHAEQRAQSGKLPLGFEELQSRSPVVPRSKLPPIGNGRDPLLEVSLEPSPWNPPSREEDIVDEARRRIREEHRYKPTIVRPDRLL
jgi:hypothetical protein